MELALDENSDDPNTFFAVYDGHGGSSAAKYAGENVHKRLLKEETYKKKEYTEAMRQAFLNTDTEMRNSHPFTNSDPSGCTAVAALITNDNRIFVANAGDSRSVISVKGEVKPLSFDHKPVNDEERTRIVNAGGYVEFGRVNGNLALARALGDFEFKKNRSIPAEQQIITSNPQVTEHLITEEDEFLIIACDGIWDCLTSQQAVDVIRLLISQGKSLAETCEIVCDHCLAPDTTSGAGIGCDNMTVLIVALLHGRTEEEWAAWITDRVKQKYGYDTPTELPQLYSANRLESFRARMKSGQDREREGRSGSPSGTFDTRDLGPFAGIARVLGNSSGVPFYAGAANGGFMFLDDGEGSEDEDEDHPHKAQDYPQSSDRDGDTPMSEADEDEGHHVPGAFKDNVNEQRQGEAPLPPKPLPNGDGVPAQLKSEPQGDAPSDAVRAEGLSDTSEDPTKA